MSNVVDIQALAITPESAGPTQRAIRRRSGIFVALFTTALTLAIGFTLFLSVTLLAYDGPLLAFGPGGVRIWPTAEEVARLAPLSAFSFSQRLMGAFAATLLMSPAIFIFFHLRSLFHLYARGIVFAQANARHIKFIGVGLIAYAIAPFLANRFLWLAGVTLDPLWFHVDEIQAFVIGALLFVMADVMQFGHEIEQERDGFV